MNVMTRPDLDFDARLDRLAEVAVRVGLGLAPGQELVLTAPLDAVPLVRRITEHAYKAGAKAGQPALLRRADDAGALPARAGRRRSTTRRPGCSRAWRRRSASGAARLAIGGEDPSLLAGQDPDRVARANRARSVAYRPALELITNFAINWNIVCYATPVLGAARVPGSAGGRGGGPAVGRDLRRLAHRRGRPGGRLGRAQRDPARADRAC